ncbi:MAG: septum formation initiator family protein [Rhodospirillales bacterium]|nr:septum formation initiator family protein [Rhodospirillales bacterium]
MRTRAGQVVGPVLGFCAVVYFAYHAIEGERGLLAWWELRQELESSKLAASEIEGRRLAAENRVKRLTPSSLDLDLLDERARLMLNLGRPNESIVFVGPSEE